MAMTNEATRRSAGLLTSTLVIGKRSLLKFLRTPQLVVLGTVQGALFLLIFRYVFGGAIGVGGLDYVDFLVPRYVTTGVLLTAMGAATGIAEDLEHGTGWYVIRALAWAAGIVAAFAPVAVARFRRG